MIRKNLGKVKLIKVSTRFDILWVNLVCGLDSFFISVVYFPPNESNWDNFDDNICELEKDIMTFRNEGKVIVMGDFNSRISNRPSVIHRGHDCFIYEGNYLMIRSGNKAWY